MAGQARNRALDVLTDRLLAVGDIPQLDEEESGQEGEEHEGFGHRLVGPIEAAGEPQPGQVPPAYRQAVEA
jgi:hypothetical protein